MMLTWNTFKSDFRDNLENTIGINLQGSPYSETFRSHLRSTQMAVFQRQATKKKRLWCGFNARYLVSFRIIVNS